jgi:hypothetical protein
VSKPSNTQTPTNKKIARAAKAGGSRARSRANVSWSYWGSIVGICVAGFALIVGSVIGRNIAEAAPFAASISDKVASANKAVQKILDEKKPDAKKLVAATAKRDALLADTHWHSAYGVYKCDGYLGKIVENKYVAEVLAPTDDAVGIHAHDDGLIHIHPFLKRSAGRNAKLGFFLEAINAKITKTEISYPSTSGKREVLNVDKLKCGKDAKKKVNVSVYLWRDIKKPSRVERYTGDFNRIPLVKNGAYAFAITADGSKAPPVPPSEKSLEAPSDLPQATPTTTPAGGAPTSTVAGGSAATTVAPKTATTVAGAAPTTVAAAPTTAAVPTTTKG